MLAHQDCISPLLVPELLDCVDEVLYEEHHPLLYHFFAHRYERAVVNEAVEVLLL